MQAFEHVKQTLKSSDFLVNFDSNRPLVLACDASPYRVGAVLLRRVQNAFEALIILDWI